MWEAVIALCLQGACGDVLLPGREAATEASCLAALAAAPAPPQPPLHEAQGAARCQEAPPPLPFEEIAPGVFVHVGRVEALSPGNAGDVSNIGFVIGGASVAMIDSGGSRRIGEGAWRAVRARTALPVSHLVLTHMHPDHVLGASVFVEAGAAVVGHAGLAAALANRAEHYAASIRTQIGDAPMVGTRVPDAVDLPVEAAASIDLGGRVLALEAAPTAHTEADLILRDSESGLLFTGDLLFSEHVPVLDGSLRGWQRVLAALAEAPAAGVVPGHGAAPLPWPDALAPEAAYLDLLAADVAAAISEGARIGDAAETAAAAEAAKWQLFDLYNGRNATTAFTELEWE